MRILEKEDRPKCNGYVCLYSCLDEFSGKILDSSIRQFVIEYDYEIYASLDEGANIDDMLAEIESKVLSVTSSQMGVSNCDIKRAELQFSFGNEYNWIFPDIFLEAGDAIIASLASAPLDKVNDSKVECTEGIDNAPSDSTCIPILGSLKVGYYGNKYSEQEITYSLLNLIERGSNEDWFKNTVINKVVYAGENSETFVPSVNGNMGEGSKEQDEIDPQNNGVLSGTGIGIIVAAGAAILFGAVYLLMKTFGKKNKIVYQSTPSPTAGKKAGLRVYDSECIRANFDDECLKLETPKNGMNFDPFEVDAQIETPSFVLDANLHNQHKNTYLSTITEGSKESRSTNKNDMLARLGSPPVETMQSFSRILSESTYSDGVHGLDRSNLNESDFVESTEEYMDPEELYGSDILASPPPS